MAERGLLLRDFEVRNFLVNRRGQIRRPVSPQPPDWWNRPIPYTLYKGREITGVHVDGTSFTIRYPFGDIGQVFWMRETWFAPAYESCGRRAIPQGPGEIYYRADGDTVCWDGPWRPSTNMPHWTARPERLKLTGQRVEQLQDISGTDVIAEGVTESDEYLEWDDYVNSVAPPGSLRSTDQDWFRKFWDRHNPKHPWSANPLVWVGEFTVMEG